MAASGLRQASLRDVDVIYGTHIMLVDGSAGCVNFHVSDGLSIFKEGQFIGGLSASDISSLASYADCPATNIADKIIFMLEPGQLTRQHRESLMLSLREWIAERQPRTADYRLSRPNLE